MQLQTTLQSIRQIHIIPVNSAVGESECNGRVENAIRRAQGKIRVLRHQIEDNIGQRLEDDSPVMAWMVRTAAEILSRYTPGEDGKTAFERIRQESCVVPVVPFGEIVMYLPLKTARNSKGDQAKKIGVWPGAIERIEEVIIVTQRGVIKCRTITRLAEGEQWNANTIEEMQGTSMGTSSRQSNTTHSSYNR